MMPTAWIAAMALATWTPNAARCFAPQAARLAGQARLDGGSLEQLHDDVEEAVRSLVKMVDLDERRVPHTVDGLRLPQEANRILQLR